MNPDFMTQTRTHFDAVANHLLNQLKGDEAATLNLAAEESLFVRFNGNRVRQNTDVHQMVLSVSLQSQGRSVEQSLSLSGKLDSDRAALDALLKRSRDEVSVLAVDPNQVSVCNNGSSDEEFRGALLAPMDLVQAVVSPAQGCDLAGFYAGGVTVRANRNSAGQSHWFATETFFLDYSLYDGPRAAKGCYAGSRWDAQAWAANLARTRALLELLKRPKVDVKPGQYRTYLAPRAFSDLVGMLGWSALSAAAWKQGRCPFKKLAEKEARLSPLLTLGENFALGLSPRFNSLGEVSATRLPLIERGELSTLLVSSRSAKEYGLSANAASESEGPRAVDVAPGTLRLLLGRERRNRRSHQRSALGRKPVRSARLQTRGADRSSRDRPGGGHLLRPFPWRFTSSRCADRRVHVYSLRVCGAEVFGVRVQIRGACRSLFKARRFAPLRNWRLTPITFALSSTD
jgi:predicted Zn-dependent protease